MRNPSRLPTPMTLILTITPTDDNGQQQIGTAIHTRMFLPHGCGLDVATEQIEKSAELFKQTALELYRARTEGREPDFSK
jgi:hypothetical protein